MRWIALVAGLVMPLLEGEPIPRMERTPQGYRWLVNGKPFVMLGAQVRNSSGWPSQLASVWPQMKALGVNTVEIPVYWEQVEPRRGEFQFGNVDTVVREAREQGFRLALLWFGTWKNGVMDYAPEWVKSNPAEFPRMVDRGGQAVRVLSPHARTNREADARAFRALMKHLKEIDGEQRTVVLVQVENEPGSLEVVRDYSVESNRAFAGAAPERLTAALKKKSGTWTEVFGGEAEEAFAAYHVAEYVNAVAAAGKAEYPLPMSVNVWLREEKTFQRPGENYPSGGATSNMLDLWKAMTPAVDVIAPDIYTQHYREYQMVCEKYGRKDNPLLIPETGGSLNFARYAFYALGDYGAIGFAPFGTNQQNTASLAAALEPMAASFRLLGPALGQIAELQGTGRLKSAVEEHMLTNRLLTFEKWEVVAMFGFPPQLSYGGLFAPGTKDRTGRALIGQLSENEFLILGFDTFVQFKPSRGQGREHAQFLRVEEGTFEQGRWKMARQWNGDEVFFGLLLPPGGTILKATLTSY